MSSDVDGGIELAEVCVRFGEASQPTLENISLRVGVGEFVVIVGPSGCGKTTILNLIAGLLSQTSGTVRVGGEAPRRGNSDIGYMLARDALLGWRTVLANAEFGAEIRGRPRSVRREHARSLLRRVGLEGYEDYHIKALSQGMRQRVAIARTFCLEAPILLMDEPFAAVDPQTKIQLENALLELWMAERRSVLFITHDVSEAIALADRVIVMGRSPGRIVATVDVELPRPRDISRLQVDPKFHKMLATIWRHLGVEVQSGGD